MTTIFTNQDKYARYITLLCLILIVGISPLKLYEDIPWGDELVMVGVAKRFPDYHTELLDYTAGQDLDFVNKNYEHYSLVYDVEFYCHPPIAVILSYPLVRITDNLKLLRIFSWLVFSLTIAALFYLLYEERKEWLYLVLPAVVMLLGFGIICNATNTFYHDTFMLAFLTGSIFLWRFRDGKYRKFSYITLALMVNCKIYAFLFLIPFMFQERKVILLSLTLLPYFIWAYFSTGNFFFPITHRAITVASVKSPITLLIFEGKIYGALVKFYEVASNLFWEYFPFLIGSSLLAITAVREKNYQWFSLWVIALFIPFSWGIYYYHMFPLYFCTPLLLLKGKNG